MEYESLCMLGCTAPAMMALMLTTSVVGTAATYIGQKRQAKGQQAYQNSLMKAQQEAYLAEASSARVQQEQQSRATAFQTESVRREAMAARGEAQAAMSESGATGLTYASAISAFDVQEANMVHRLQEEERLRSAHTDRSLEALRMGTQQQLLSINRPVAQPNALAMGMNLISKNALPVWDYGVKHFNWGNKPLDATTGRVNQHVEGWDDDLRIK